MILEKHHIEELNKLKQYWTEDLESMIKEKSGNYDDYDDKELYKSELKEVYRRNHLIDDTEYMNNELHKPALEKMKNEKYMSISIVSDKYPRRPWLLNYSIDRRMIYDFIYKKLEQTIEYNNEVIKLANEW